MKNINGLYIAILSLVFFQSTGAYAQIPIGISAPLSGALSEYGTAISRGITLARQEVIADTAAVNFIFEDNQFDSKHSISAFRSLVALQGIESLYSWGEPALYATRNMIKIQKVPTFSLSNDDIPARNNSYLCNLQVPPEIYAEKILKKLRIQGHKKFILIVAQDPFTEAMARGFRSRLTDDETIVADQLILP